MNAIHYPLTIYFDGACAICSSEIAHLARRDRHGRLVFVDASPPDFTGGPAGVEREALLEIIHAVRPDGSVARGVEVFHLAYRAVGLEWVSRLIGLPGIAGVARSAYPWIARHRYQLPRWLVRPLFGSPLRNAAFGASGSPCRDGACRLNR